MSDSITQLIAIYGAIVSSILVGWTIYRDIKDVGRVQLKCGFRELITPGTDYVEEDILVYTVTNIGTRPVIITNLGGDFSDGKGFILTDDNIPKTFSPGEYFMFMARSYEDMAGRVESLKCWDSLGREYKASRKDLRQVQKQLEELASKGIVKSHIEKI